MEWLKTIEVKDVIEELSEIMEDNTIPKNVKSKVMLSISILNENCDQSIKINKVLNELDEIADDSNMQSYVRTRLWNIVSMLEKCC